MRNLLTRRELCVRCYAHRFCPLKNPHDLLGANRTLSFTIHFFSLLSLDPFQSSVWLWVAMSILILILILILLAYVRYLLFTFEVSGNWFSSAWQQCVLLRFIVSELCISIILLSCPPSVSRSPRTQRLWFCIYFLMYFSWYQLALRLLTSVYEFTSQCTHSLDIRLRLLTSV